MRRFLFIHHDYVLLLDIQFHHQSLDGSYNLYFHKTLLGLFLKQSKTTMLSAQSTTKANAFSWYLSHQLTKLVFQNMELLDLIPISHEVCLFLLGVDLHSEKPVRRGIEESAYLHDLLDWRLSLAALPRAVCNSRDGERLCAFRLRFRLHLPQMPKPGRKLSFIIFFHFAIPPCVYPTKCDIILAFC